MYKFFIFFSYHVVYYFKFFYSACYMMVEKSRIFAHNKIYKKEVHEINGIYGHIHCVQYGIPADYLKFT